MKKMVTSINSPLGVLLELFKKQINCSSALTQVIRGFQTLLFFIIISLPVFVEARSLIKIPIPEEVFKIYIGNIVPIKLLKGDRILKVSFT